MTRKAYRRAHRNARLGNLGTLAMSLPPADYNWFLEEVYDLRNPRVGSERHMVMPRSFDSLRGRLVKKGKRYVRVVTPDTVSPFVAPAPASSTPVVTPEMEAAA